jgi:uncharacterized protein (TIGR02246 family)
MRNLINVVAASAAVAAMSPAIAAGQPAPSAADTRAVIAVLAKYKAAIERLDPRGTERLFAADSQIFESGGAEGTYANYLEHHLTPELGEFKSFAFSDYRIDVRFVGGVALATETYRYRIVPKAGGDAERLGVATSVLRKAGGEWRIVSMHNSARRPKAS